MENKEEVFVLELPLVTDKNSELFLNNRMELLRHVYNAMNAKMKKRYDYIRQMKRYQWADTFKKKTEFDSESEYKAWKKESQKVKAQILKDNGFTQFGFGKFVGNFNYKDSRFINAGINSTLLGDISDNLWAAWDKFLWGNGNNTYFKKKGELNSFSNRYKKGFIGYNIDFKKNILHINCNGKTKNKAKYITLPFRVNRNSEYEIEALDNELRVITIVRKYIRGQYKFYLQLTLKGTKPNKYRKLGEGKVGIDIGSSTVAVVSDTKVMLNELAEGVDRQEREIKIIRRAIDRSRKATNPNLFTKDGQIVRLPKGTKREWNNSKRYIKLNDKLKDMLRKQAVYRKNKHLELANSLLPLGNDFIVENNPITAWAKKAKETTINKNGKINKKKRLGKSIGNKAPAMFVTILENKVKSLGGTFTKIDINNAASQYDFTNGEFTPHKLNERNITLSNGDIHLRDTLAAFNIQNIVKSEKKQYNNLDMSKKYSKFVALEKEEIERHLLDGKPSNVSMGIKGYCIAQSSQS